MGGISDEYVEWAIVNRLKAMLDEPPKTTFNVTQGSAPMRNNVEALGRQVAWSERVTERCGKGDSEGNE